MQEVPGYNGSGSAMLEGRWSRFADEHALVLLAPTFPAAWWSDQKETLGFEKNGSCGVPRQSLPSSAYRRQKPNGKTLRKAYLCK